MSRVFPALTFLLWPAVLIAGLVTVGMSSTTALSLVNDGLKSTVRGSDQILPYRAHRVAASLSAPKNRALLWTARSIASPDPVITPPPRLVRAVAKRELTLRSKPLQTAQAVQTIRKGETLTVKSKQGRWWLVSTDAAREGWLYGSYLTLEKT